MGNEPKKDNVKLSRKLEYACRVLAQLGRSHEDNKLAHIDALAAAEAIPANYLVQILNELRGAGLVISKRGKQGGYALTKEPGSISLKEIVVAVDSELLECSFEKSGHSGSRVAAIWTEMSEALEKKLREYSLEDFIVHADDGGMYYI